MQIILTGLEEYGLDGKYDLDHHPTGAEMNRFRKAAEMSPSELNDAIANGAGLDIVRMYAFTALERAGNPTLAAKVFDIPLDRLGGIEVEGAEEEEIDKTLPPTSGSASDESET